MATIDSQQQLAYQQIKRSLLAGEFPPGQRLSRRKLAATTGVSAPSVQHVLGQLANEGLVEVRPQSGTYPRILSTAEFGELAVLRRLLEPHAAAEAASRASAKQHAVLKSCVRDMLTTADKIRRSANPVDEYLDDWYQLERLFHTTIWRAAGNSLIAATLENLHILALAAMKAHELAEVFCQSTQGTALEHQQIQQAIAAHDAAAASAAMAHHLRPNPWDAGNEPATGHSL